MLAELLVIAGLSLGSSMFLVWLTRRWARTRMVLDHPNDRSLHRDPTPLGGGIGILLPVCLALAAVAIVRPAMRADAWALLVGGLLVAGIGLADDLKRLPALGRLTVHCCAAGVLVAAVGVWHRFTWSGLWGVELAWSAVPLTFLWVVGLTNAYNFMDGIDGIAGSQGVAAGLGWMLLGCVISDPLLAVVGTVIASASTGFLLFNWPPASIFMGDVGSAFVGFVFAALPVLASTRSPDAATAGTLFVWPFVFDAAFTFVRRAWRRENLLLAHRSHLYQRLVLTGLSHRTVTLAYSGLATVGLVAGMALVLGARIPAAAGLAAIALLAVALLGTVLAREAADRRISVARSAE